MTKSNDKKKLTRGEKWLLVAPLLALMACCVFSNSLSAQRVLKSDDPISQLTPKEQVVFVKQWAKKGVLVFINSPGYWNEIDDLDLTLAGVYHFGEPLSVPMLNALERNFKKSTNQSLRERTAALLYRYGRPTGRNYFANLLQKRDLRAATIFALNRETSSINGVIKVLQMQSSEERDDTNLVLALRVWRHPEIKKILLRKFKTVLDEDQGGSLNYALTLAKQDAHEAIPLIRRITKTISPGEVFAVHNKASIAGALIKLRAPESPQLMKYLRQQLSTKEKAFSRRAVIEALGVAATPEAIATLQSVIRRYLAMPLLAKPPYRPTIETTEPDEMAILAAEQLSGLNHKLSTQLISQLLTRLKKESAARPAAIEYSRRIGRVALATGTPTNSELVSKFFGQEWTNNEIILRKLNKIPNYFLPPQK